MAATSRLYGGIEAGGTKFVCAVGETPQAIQASTSIPTTTPTATLNQVITFFRSYPIQRLGLATFGPIDLDRDSPTYGYILSTPKLAWQGCPIVDILTDRFGGAGGRRHRRQRGSDGGGRIRGRTGMRSGRLPDCRHRHRRRRHDPWTSPPWADAPRDGAYAAGTRAGRYPTERLSVS